MAALAPAAGNVNPWTTRDIACVALKGAGALLAIAAVSSLTGHALTAAGGALAASKGSIAASLGMGLKGAGHVALVAGKYAFLTVSVPLYAIYSGIKWTILKGIPLAAKGVALALQALWQKLLVPIGQLLLKGAILLKDYVLSPLLTAIKSLFVLVKDIFCGAAKGLWNYLIAPVGKFIFHRAADLCYIIKTLAVSLYQYILKPIGILVKTAVVTLFNNILAPIAVAIKNVAVSLSKVIVSLAKDILYPLAKLLCQGVVAALKGFYSYVLSPIGQGLVKLATVVSNVVQWVFTKVILAGLKAIYNYLMVPIGQALSAGVKLLAWAVSALFKGIGQLLSACFTHIIYPLYQITVAGYEGLVSIICTISKFVFNYLLKPLFWLLKTLAVGLAKGLYNYVLTPIWHVGSAAVKMLATTVQAVFGALYSYVLQPAYQQITGFFSWAAHNISYAAAQGATELSNTFRYLQSLFG